jgi:hypothetical protein
MKKKESTQKDVYKPVWTLNDTILTLYAAKYPDKLNRLGFHDSSSTYTAYDDLCNHAIGSTGFSLKRQIGNIEFLMGKNESQWSTSNVQKKVYDEYNHLTEDELFCVCSAIVESVPPSVYDKFAEKEKKNQGIEKAQKGKKSREFFKKESDANLCNEFKRMGKDMSRFKSVGVRPN